MLDWLRAQEGTVRLVGFGVFFCLVSKVWCFRKHGRIAYLLLLCTYQGINILCQLVVLLYIPIESFV